MGLITYLQNRKINKALSLNNRLKKMKNLGKIRSLLVLCSIKTPDDLIKWQQYFKNIDSQIKKVDVLFYLPMNIVKESRQGLDEKIIYPHQLSWIGMPKDDKYLKSYMDFNYDLLIDINFDSIFALKWIFVKSQAALKVGPQAEDNHYYDLMINTEDAENKTKLYINQIFYFLRQINNNG